jgi:hypothetical protein
MDTYAYKHALKSYIEDLINLSGEKVLVFLKDNAPCYVSKDSKKKIK